MAYLDAPDVITPVFLASLLLIGTALTVVALRGRPVDSHPRCRKCRYDLTGKPDSSTRCPECGADLSQPHAVRICERERRPLLLGVGLLVVLLAGAATIPSAVRGARTFDYYPYLPDSWLVSELANPVPGNRQRARATLTRRLLEDGLHPSAQIASGADGLFLSSFPAAPVGKYGSLADDILARQADATKPWYPEQGDYIEALFLASRLDLARLRRYAGQIPRFRVGAQPHVRDGDALLVAALADDRSGSRGLLSMRYDITYSLTPPPTASPAQIAMFDGPDLREDQLSRGVPLTPEDDLARLPPVAPGTSVARDLYLVVRWKTFPVVQGFAGGPSKLPAHVRRVTPAYADEPVASGVSVLPMTITRFPAEGKADLVPVRRDGLDQTVAAALKPIRLEHTPRAALVLLSVRVVNPPTDLAYRVFVVTPDGPILVDYFTVAAGAREQVDLVSSEFPAALPPKVDLLFVPEPEAARTTLRQSRYADVEVRLKDVPVTVVP